MSLCHSPLKQSLSAVPLPVAYVRAVELFRLEGTSGRHPIYSSDLKQGQFQVRYHQYLYRVLFFISHIYSSFSLLLAVRGELCIVETVSSVSGGSTEHCVFLPLSRGCLFPLDAKLSLGASLGSCSSIYWRKCSWHVPTISSTVTVAQLQLKPPNFTLFCASFCVCGLSLSAVLP